MSYAEDIRHNFSAVQGGHVVMPFAIYNKEGATFDISGYDIFLDLVQNGRAAKIYGTGLYAYSDDSMEGGFYDLSNWELPPICVVTFGSLIWNNGIVADGVTNSLPLTNTNYNLSWDLANIVATTDGNLYSEESVDDEYLVNFGGPMETIGFATDNNQVIVCIPPLYTSRMKGSYNYTLRAVLRGGVFSYYPSTFSLAEGILSIKPSGLGDLISYIGSL